MIHTNGARGSPAETGKRWRVLVISGSVRPGRLAPSIARWVMANAPPLPDLELELTDLADWPLPDEEPEVPAVAKAYHHPQTRAWSATVANASGFVFVTPQYNWGYPAALKNSLDHLHREWTGKPAVIVSYGFHGGGRCAAQLRQVLKGLRMQPALTMPALTLPPEMKDGAPVERALEAFGPAANAVEQAFTELRTLLTEAG